jgi:hypothetical protein
VYKKFALAFLVTLCLCLSVFADGNTSTPGYTSDGNTSTPGITSSSTSTTSETSVTAEDVLLVLLKVLINPTL